MKVETGERSELANRLVPTVTITIKGRRFVYDACDHIDAMHVAADVAKVLGVRLGMEE